MFIGRKNELNLLERLYASDHFEYLVMYGRRRVGKTEILKEFSKSHKVCFYSAVEKKSNLEGFGKTILACFHESADLSFHSWEGIFSYISEHTAVSEKTVIIIDEFPYIAETEPDVKSILQHTIDHFWQNKNIFLILCGSSVSFMLNTVMGQKTPLYGRNTAVMEVLPFDYTETSVLLPDFNAEQKMIAYGILGGIPYYLLQFSDKKTIEQNISDCIVDFSATLKEEPMTLLKSEVREPAIYNSIIEAVASGAVKLTEIAAKAGIEATKTSVYLKNLQEMRIIEKVTPCGEKTTGKKSQYILTDHFFSFWYRYIFPQKTKMELMEPILFAEDICRKIHEHMGLQFERICLQYLRIEAKKGTLPFIPSKLGKWWGTNPVTKKQDDIDILGIDGNKYLFCECKFRNERFDLSEFHDLLLASARFTNAKEKYYYIFVKSGFTKSVLEKSRNYNIKLITIEDMF